jgi:hypothetical protein
MEDIRYPKQLDYQPVRRRRRAGCPLKRLLDKYDHDKLKITNMAVMQNVLSDSIPIIEIYTGGHLCTDIGHNNH